MRGRLVLSAIVTLAAAAPSLAVHAQQADAVAQAVRIPVDRMFEGMKARDTLMIQSAFVPVGRLISIRDRAGQPTVVSSLAPADFARGLLRAPAGDLLERLWDFEVKVEDNVATAWAKYTFHIGEKFSHCGIDAFQLAKTSDGWKIVQIMDTQRQTGCTGPDGKELKR